jgi:hypothetical protein
LRENAKKVIGIGVKQSTSDLLIANCDEFIFYDDLVRESQRSSGRREMQEAPAAPRRSPEEDKHRKDELEARKSRAVEVVVETFDALVAERGDGGKIWASVLKEAIKRRRPDFNESNYGFRAFGNLLEEAQARGLLEFGRDEKSGAYVYRSGGSGRIEAPVERTTPVQPMVETVASDLFGDKPEPRRRGRGGRKSAPTTAEVAAAPASGAPQVPAASEPAPPTTAEDKAVNPADKPSTRSRRPRKPALKPGNA